VDALAEIKRLYYNTTRTTIQRDLSRAVDLLKSMKDDDERQRAAVYMDGLSQMRSEWGGGQSGSGRGRGGGAGGRR
jgi:hypothetical protein